MSNYSFVQIAGHSGNANFAFSFPYLVKEHIHVKVAGVETFAFSWLNANTVTLTVPLTGDAVVELRRLTPVAVQEVVFNNGSTMNEDDLNNADLQTLYFDQEMLDFKNNALVIGATGTWDAQGLVISNVADPVNAQDAATKAYVQSFVITPALDLVIDAAVDAVAAQEVISVAAVVAVGDSTIATLTDLDLSASASADDAAASALAAAASALQAAADAIIAQAATFTTGDAKITLKTVADPTWIMADDGSIGDASSSATNRANADTSALFAFLWAGFSDAVCPVSGGRGGSGAADFLAHKRITVPATLGRLLGFAGAGAGLTSRALGETLGSEDAVNIAHTHSGSVTDPGHAHGIPGSNGDHANVGPSGITGYIYDPMGDSTAYYTTPQASAYAGTGITMSADTAGVSGTGLNMPPATFLKLMIKL